MRITRLAHRLGGCMALIACCMMALAACGTTGESINSSALERIVPGQTTLEQAVALLGSEPVNTYRQLDGATTARWANKASVMTDAIYFRQELWLAFGSDGRFQRIVKQVNVPGTIKPAAPLPTQADPRRAVPPAPGSGTERAVGPLSGVSVTPIDAPVVTYPLK